MTLIPFDEYDQHQFDKFKYFSEIAGHPQYIIDDDISEMDIGLREFIQKKFNLEDFFVDECNGSCHKLISRCNAQAKFEVCFNALDDNDEDFEWYGTCTGELLFDSELDEILFKPDLNSIVII